jgi:hypothetical protein
VPTGKTYAIDLKNGFRQELYLNTLVDVAKANSAGWTAFGDASHDIKCNAVINGVSALGTAGSSTVVDNNSFYNTPLATANGTGTNISKQVKTRANSTWYAAGDIIITSSSSNCTVANQSACFMYMVTGTGTSSASPPSYCTTLGCSTTDGTMTSQAIRGPYTFYRKLRTGSEQYVIPYARAHSAAPDAFGCPSGYSSRKDIGINDSQ